VELDKLLNKRTDPVSTVHMTHSLPVLPPLEGFVAVLAAANAGSFTCAAEDLGVTHATVSRRVAMVETWLGATLFERQARGVAPTPAGLRFLSEIEDTLNRIERAADRWRPRIGGEVVRLSLVPSFAKLWLLPRFPALQGGLAGCRIELLIEHRQRDLEAREADLVVRYGHGPWPGIDVEPLFHEHLAPAASPALAAHIGVQTSAAEIARHPLIHDSDTRQWRAWLAAEHVQYQPRQIDRRFEDYDMVLAAAAAGMGSCLVRLPLATDWLASGKLVLLSDRRSQNPASHFLGMRQRESRPAVLHLAMLITKLASS
jgi:LysR family transcriptional regulator, glycine cleavage system transcriptional activator